MRTEPTIPLPFHRFPQLTANYTGALWGFQRAFPCWHGLVLSESLQKGLLERLDAALYEYDPKTKLPGKRRLPSLVYPKRVRWTTDFCYMLGADGKRRILYGNFTVHGKKFYVGSKPHETAPSKVRRQLTPRTRWDVLTRGGYRCCVCGATAADGAKLHVDHILPVSLGGTNEPDNLRVLCATCNLGRGNQYDLLQNPL